ncbi:DUF3995 domain-containing protein [Kitasatospora sp. NPDC057198]|uniref:DUF3995 domain-containing protein n=1 Tax=Kitasatospora sp. NPDC057198 TaxID=3346046 RepID=UPI003640E580
MGGSFRNQGEFMRSRVSPGRRWGHAAAAWSGIFAGAHFYWALGGSKGLDVSAGSRLAEERPLWFVAAGLWGVGSALVVGAVLGRALARTGPTVRRGRILEWLGWATGLLLLARGVAVELLLLTDATGLEGAVSQGQRFWTLALWNPWFIAGGLSFALAALAYRFERTGGPPTGRYGAGARDKTPEEKEK